jgi:hypothetical protein
MIMMMMSFIVVSETKLAAIYHYGQEISTCDDALKMTLLVHW